MVSSSGMYLSGGILTPFSSSSASFARISRCLSVKAGFGISVFNLAANFGGSNITSAAGDISISSVFSSRRCVSGSKYDMLSISSPQNSMRQGFSEFTGNKSKIPPRTENCPEPSQS